MYKILYYSEYSDLNNNLIRLEILKNNYSGNATELMLSNPAITVDYQAEDFYKPIKKSGASINLLVPNVIQNLFTGELSDPQVRIYRNGVLFWFGYITPNIYNQEYKNEYDVLTLECVDSLSNLENLDFAESDSEIVSFFDIITSLLDKVDTEKLANTIYIPKSVAIGDNTDILNNLYIQQRNFLDEKGEPQKADEVISDLLQYLGFQMCQYKNAYYIIDVDAIKANNYNFFAYNRTSGTTTDATLNLSAREVMDIGIALGTGNVSLNGVYNKVTLIANNNPLSAILPSFDDEDDIVNQNENPNKYYEEEYTFNDEAHTLLSGFFKSKENWNYTIPSGTTEGELIPTPQIDEVTTENRDTISIGIFWQKVDSYKTEDGEPSSLSWKTYLTMVDNGLYYLFQPKLKLNSTKTMILDGGYLVLNLKYKFSTDTRAHDVVKSMYKSSDTFGSCSDLTWSSDSDNIGNGNWPDNTLFPCRLTIDNHFFDGDVWRDYDWFNARVARGYYNFYGHNINMGHVGDGDTNWYRIKDDYDDWNYVTKAVYNSSTKRKETGKSKPNNMYWWVENGTKVFIAEEYYNECILQDWFYLVHRNKVTETIYDTEYELTNTVSYKMNIIDSSDGIAVKCPTDFALYGKLNFELRPTSKLGHNPQYRSDKAETQLRAIHISDLSIKYSKSTSYNSIYSNSTADPDITYTNVISSGYCQEMEDITLRVNTENDIATSYSYVMGKDANDKYYYIKGLTFLGTESLAENRLVERYVNHYKQPKYKYGNTLVNDNVTPFSLIREHNINKTMIVTNASYDLSNDRVNIDCEQL